MGQYKNIDYPFTGGLFLKTNFTKPVSLQTPEKLKSWIIDQLKVGGEGFSTIVSQESAMEECRRDAYSLLR